MEGSHRRDGAGDRRSSAGHRPPPHRAVDEHAGRRRRATPGAYKPFEFERFVSAPITTIHLWYDREVADLDHAVLLDTRIQWLFAKSRIRGWEPSLGSYLELVVSASWPEIAMSREADSRLGARARPGSSSPPFARRV